MNEAGKTLKGYYSNLSKDQSAELERIKKVAMSLVPDAEEVLSYGIPTLDYKKKHLVHYAAFADHYSIFPGSEVVNKFKEELSQLDTSKGTIRYANPTNMPEKLILKLIEARIAQIS